MLKLFSNTKILIILILFTNSIIHAEETRFLQIIRLYKNPDFIDERRNVTLDFKNITDNNQTFIYPAVIDNDTAIFDANNVHTLLLFKLRKNRGTTLTEKGRIFTAGFRFEKNDQAFDTLSSQYFLDTTTYLFELRGKYQYNNSKYLVLNNKNTTSFIQMILDVNGGISHYKKRGYDRDLESIDNDTINLLKYDWLIQKKQNATILVDFIGGIGVGKHVNTTPVYQIAMLEKRLIENGVADFRLSNKTVASIARLLAINNSYKLKKFEKTKEFKSELDSIIIKDPSVKKENLRYISPLDIKKILLCNAPVFNAKPKVRLFTKSRAFFNLYRMENEYPYGEYNPISDTSYKDTSYIKPKFRYEHLLGIDFVWGTPFTHFWFLEVRGIRNLLSTDKEIDFYDTNKHVKWDEVLDTRWDLQSSLWFSNWILLQLGLNNLPTWIIIPNELQYKSYLNLTIFIEDYISLTTEISYYKHHRKHDTYLNWHEPLNRIYNGLLFSINATYNF